MSAIKNVRSFPFFFLLFLFSVSFFLLFSDLLVPKLKRRGGCVTHDVMLEYFSLISSVSTILDSPCAAALRQGGGNISRGLLEACLRNQDEWPCRETVKQSGLFT